ncbi:MAG TPA: outer membrane beta-barrel protein [Cyclobacteriaceae bacterium]|nr:outer membrane beta-barrel protein [Cyclobacteriaceae bacterium]HRF34364.1 outer membrane beta-barrel protein [Cyclobacteriaceae bacterium]
MKFILSLALTVAISTTGFSQFKKKASNTLPKPKPSQQNKFLEKQWWLGFKAGTNFAQAKPIKSYTVMVPTKYAAGLNAKEYDSFSKTGSQATLEATFYYKGISFSVQPTYRHTRFTYFNQFRWYNTENSAETLELRYDQEQKIDYADFPLFIKYDILRDKLRPYVQVGIVYSMLINANKAVAISGTDYASGGTNQFANETLIVGAKDLYENYWGIAAGVGVDYNLGNVRLVLEGSYWKGMSNITNTKNRFGNDRLAGIGDVPDDLDLNNIIISAGVLFPMRFLSSNFKTLDR